MEHYKQVIAELRKLIDPNVNEREIQVFLEQYPWLLTGTHPTFDVISQFPLGSDFLCDFAYFFSWSSGSFIQLIEIESPRLEIFNANDEFSQKFNHALQQLDDWSSWVDRNRETIRYMLEPLVENGPLTDMPSFTNTKLKLIAGRRSQLSNPRRKRRWQERIKKLPGNTEVRTYDGFLESLPLARFEDYGTAMNVECVRYKQQGYSKLE